MKCVGYDADFQLNLIEKSSTFVPKPKKVRKGRDPKGQRATKQGSNTKAGQKRKRVEVESEDEEPELEDDTAPESEDEDLGFTEKPISGSRGTRSRPIRV